MDKLLNRILAEQKEQSKMLLTIISCQERKPTIENKYDSIIEKIDFIIERSLVFILGIIVGCMLFQLGTDLLK